MRLVAGSNPAFPTICNYLIKGYKMLKMNKKVICRDGFSMSVQANSTSYCSPRVSNADRYTDVEVGFPNKSEDLLLEYAEDPDSPTETVYPYVPTTVVSLVIAKHGGMIEGEVPAGIPILEAT
tara:strand:+ start:86 stop:454 length:369 start_codon:yes stop_codon:yes gene_type:complete